MANSRIVHVIDDDDAMRDSLSFLLDVQGFETRVYESALAFLDALPGITGGCVLTDVRMPGLSGMELIDRLRSEGCDLPVVVMTGHGDVPMAVEAMKAGVTDFIEKPFADDVLLRAVRNALDREAAPSQDDGLKEARSRLATLSPRERDVLAGVVAGKANKVIAYDLGISPRTVEIYRANLMTKTGARNMAELMRLALAAGL